jgi:hypothetical protein
VPLIMYNGFVPESGLNKYINALIVCKKTFGFAVSLFFSKLKLIQGSKYSTVQMPHSHTVWPSAYMTLFLDMDMSYARVLRTASLTSYPVSCKM